MIQGKKGQLTLFIIIGIVIVLLVGGGIFYFTSFRGTKEQVYLRGDIGKGLSLDSNSELVYSYVQDCLELNAINGVFELGRQGGYYALPKETLKTEKDTIPFFYRPHRLLYPNHRRLVTEYQNYIKDKVTECVDLSLLEKRGLKIAASEPKVIANFLEDNTYITLEYPLEIIDGDKRQKLEKWNYVLPFDYEYVFEMYTDIADTIYDNPKYTDLTQLVSFTDYQVFVVPINDTTSIYVLSTYLHGIPEKEERYNFMFAVER